jgi:Methylamine utilisation protein MauE
MLDPAFGYLIVAGTALLLAGAAIQKFRGLARFADIVVAYRVLPPAFGGPVARLIPCLEAAIALALVWQPVRNGAVIAAMVLLIAYAAGLSVNLLRGRRDLDCGCGAARDRRPIAAWMVWRNLLLAVALGFAVLPWSSRSLNLTDWLTIVGGLTVVTTLYAAADRLFGDVVPKTLMLRSHS